jgi:hypothetical protein
MRLFGKRDDSGLEGQLRSRRAEPPPGFVRALAQRVDGESRWVRPKTRYALLAVLTVALLAASVSAGVTNVASTSADTVIHFVGNLTVVTEKPSTKLQKRSSYTLTLRATPADDQYICGVIGGHCPAQITPTAVSCAGYVSGTAPSLGQVNYSGDTKIGQNINPGVFFYYAQVSGPAGTAVTVTQSHTGSAPIFLGQGGQAILWNEDCTKAVTGSVDASGGASFTLPTAGTFFIGIKYSTKSIVGDPVPNPSTSTYTFSSPGGSATMQLVKS